MKTIKFEKLNIEIEVKTDKIGLFEIKELKDRVQIFFEDEKIFEVLPNSRVGLRNFAHAICYKGRAIVFSDALVSARGVSRIEAREASRVEAFDRAYVTAYDESYVVGYSWSTIRAYDTSRVMGCDECVIRAYNTSTITGFDSSFIIARDNVNCILFQGSEVRASGHAKIRALDTSRVTARGYAEVNLEGQSLGYKKPYSRAKISKLDNRAAVFES